MDMIIMRTLNGELRELLDLKHEIWTSEMGI